MASREERTKARLFLKELGISPSENNVVQLMTFVEALRIYVERSKAYGNVWRQYGALSNLLSAARKTDRLMEYWWHSPDGAKQLGKDALDDAFDLLNYTVFFIRNVRDLNLAGAEVKRPKDEVAAQRRRRDETG